MVCVYKQQSGVAMLLIVVIISEGCVEEALRRIQIDNSYTVSNFPLSIGSESCIISVEDNIGQKIITIVGNTDNYYKKIRVIISIVGEEIAIQSWEELTE